MSTSQFPLGIPLPSIPFSLSLSMANRTQLEEDLSPIADAMGLQPMSVARRTLLELVYRLEKNWDFRQRFLPGLHSNYDWASHRRDPARVVKNTLLLPCSPASHCPSKGTNFLSDCIRLWEYSICEEVDYLVREPTEDLSWFPRSKAQRRQKVALAYASFLFVYLRTGMAPEVVGQHYADAVNHLGTF
ncbi:hypothetical protein F5B21DRAFT_170270 [Xylaria acuta]|nr:hypothetical protein F5B21DRAFT_170270 [Xylaria acuta]